MTWPEPVERVASYLRAAGAEARLEEFETGTPTAEAAAAAAGCSLSEIVKSLVFDCDGTPIVVMVPGDRRASPKRIARAAGCRRARVAGPELVQEATGFAPGAVAPFPLARIDRVYLDTSLLRHETVWIGAGSDRHLAELSPQELARLARARPIEAVEGVE
jgi:Cys-tRNA(Pro) deacylase